MKIILRISPHFIRRFDSYLRTNHPTFWATLFHLNLYCAILFMILFSLFGLLIRVDIQDIPSQSYITTVFVLLFIPATAWLIFMIKQLSLFNIDKIFGLHKRFSEFGIFIIYFITFALPLVIPYSTVTVLNLRIANLVNQKDVNEDITNYFKGKMFFPTEKYDYEYYFDNMSYLKYGDQKTFSQILSLPDIEAYINKYDTLSEAQVDYINDIPYNNLKDSVFYQSGEFKIKRPSLYYIIEVYPTRELENSRKVELTYDKYIDSVIINFQYRQNLTRDVEAARKQIILFCELFNKYSYERRCDPDRVLTDYINHNYEQSYANRVLSDPIRDIKSNLKSIINAKQFSGYMYYNEMMVFLFVFCFYITIFFNIFKNVHWRQFLLGLSVFAVLATILIILDLIFDFRFKLFITFTILISIFCLIFFIKGFRAKQFDLFTNQSVILLNILFPILPYLLLSYLVNVHDFFDWICFDSFKYSGEQTDGTFYSYYGNFYQLKRDIFWWTFWAGIILYFVLWNTLLKRIYIKLWALPRPD
jgi:hypothetical protein